MSDRDGDRTHIRLYMSVTAASNRSAPLTLPPSRQTGDGTQTPASAGRTPTPVYCRIRPRGDGGISPNLDGIYLDGPPEQTAVRQNDDLGRAGGLVAWNARANYTLL